MSLPVLLLKIFLVPTLIFLVAVTGRRWGSVVAGCLSAFPIVSGPILLAMTLERGTHFAADAALGALLAVIAIVSFGVAFAWASMWLGVTGSAACALAVYASFVLMLNAIHPSVLGALVTVVCVLLIAPLLFPEGGEAKAGVDAGSPTLSGDLPWQMFMGMVWVLVVTFAAARLDAHLSGLLAMFPIMSTTRVELSRTGIGRAVAVSQMRGMVLGYFAFATFCSLLSILLLRLTADEAFVCAVACALFVQLIVGRIPPLIVDTPSPDRR